MNDMKTPGALILGLQINCRGVDKNNKLQNLQMMIDKFVDKVSFCKGRKRILTNLIIRQSNEVSF